MAMSALIAAAAVISSIAIVGGFSKDNDPMAELRRQQVSREVADFKVPSTNYLHTDPPDTTVVSKVKTSSNAAFSVLSDERIIDLRNWKKVPDDRLGEFYSPITSTRRLRVRRLSPCDTFEIEGRTSGLNLFFNSQDRLPFKVEVQKEQSFVGSERMNVKKMIVDVSSQPSDDEFSFRAQMTYWNNIQNESEQWFGVIGYEKSLLVSLLILFPPDHPMKDFTLNIAPTMNDVAVPFTGHRIVLTGPKNDWVYWEVPQPEPGHVYRLAWKW